MAKWCDELTQLRPGQSHSSMEKSVGVNDQLSQKLEPQEVDSFVLHQGRMVKQGDRLRAHHQRFEDLFKWDTNNESLRIYGVHEKSLH